MSEALLADASEPHRWVVLYIDDNPANLAVLDQYLLDRGFEVLIARDSASGLEQARIAQPDLILLDVLLPEQDGFETCTMLKADPRTQQIPVIFVTAIADNIQHTLRGFELGAVDYITKPFQKVEVLARITTHLRLQDLTRRLQQQTTTLQQEVNERKRAEEELRAYQELVTARTTELMATNQRLEREVVERQQTEETLQLTRFTVDHVADAVYWIDPQARIVDVNDAACALLGYSRDELKGLDLSAIDVEFSLARWPEIWKHLKDMSRHTLESQHRTKDGRLIPVEIIANYIEFGGRELDCAVVRDITERKRNEEMLRLTRFTIERVADAIYWVDAQARIVDVNDAACHMLGYTREELTNKLVMDIDGTVEQERQEAFRQNLRQSRTTIFETKHRRKDGRIVPVELVASLIFFEGQELNCVVARDITDRKQAEQRLKASLHEKEVLLKEIHHRVKNNLQIITSLLYLQARRIDAPSLFEMFRESQNRISSMSLVHEMLYQSDDYARINFAAYARSLMSSLLQSYGIDQRQIQPVIEATEVLLSINQAIPCGLILNEVISNALKHAFPDGRTGHVSVGLAQRADGMYVLELSDDGVGLPMLPKTRTRTLGLHLVDRLVQQLNGTLQRSSASGTAYQIVFPSDTHTPGV